MISGSLLGLLFGMKVRKSAMIDDEDYSRKIESGTGEELRWNRETEQWHAKCKDFR